jgi:outer membrane protein assembly factor BamB
MVPVTAAPLEAGSTDADIIWLFDIIKECKVRQHDSAHCSILLDGQFLYINTANGLDDAHRHIDAPDAPCLIVIDKATGRLVARDDGRIAPNIFHCTWSSPGLGVVKGRKMIFYAAPDGVLYAFEPVTAARDEVQTLKKIWWFDSDPGAPKTNVQSYVRNRTEGPSTMHAMPVFCRNRVYITGGGDIWWGKNVCWVKCVDATKTGDVTKTAEIWSYPLARHNLSTVAVWNGLVFAADSGRKIHCIDAETGKPCWTHDIEGEMWSSPYAADGKVYVGTRRGEFLVLAAGREKSVLSSIELDSGISATPVAANGVLYVTTQRRLYALQKSGR